MGGDEQGQTDEARWHRTETVGPPPARPLLPTASLTCSSHRRFWFRLYWFPLKVLYATCHCSLRSVPDIPFYFFFNALLLLLTVMNLYWFLVSRPPLPPSAGSPVPSLGHGPGAGPSQAHPGAGHVRPQDQPCQGPVAGVHGPPKGSVVGEGSFLTCVFPSHSTSWLLLPRC